MTMITLLCSLAAAVILPAQDQPPPQPDQEPAPREGSVDDARQEERRARERLIRKLEGGEDDVMVRVVTAMDEVERQLISRLDPGGDLPALQQQIVDDLDLAIQQARQNMRLSGGSRGQPGDDQPGGAPPPERDAGSPGGAAGEQLGSGGVQDDDIDVATDGLLQELRRQWGNLPPRAREEILQGLNEDVHEAFREHIERYYEALSRQPER